MSEEILTPDTTEQTQDTETISVADLEKQGDVAADYLEELLDIADVDGDLEIEVRNERPYVSILNEEADSQDLKNLVGKNNQVLDALQELSRIAVLAQTGQRTRLVLDIDNCRKERVKLLEKIARAAIDRVNETGQEVDLEAMGSYERKLVHDMIAEAGLISESEGQGRARHIVVKPAVQDTTSSEPLEPQLLESEEDSDQAEESQQSSL
ncbi:MAG: R3H domain-containing nucleic acid-binding protein [Micrococcaceae bacterium]